MTTETEYTAFLIPMKSLCCGGGNYFFYVRFKGPYIGVQSYHYSIEQLMLICHVCVSCAPLSLFISWVTTFPLSVFAGVCEILL